MNRLTFEWIGEKRATVNGVKCYKTLNDYGFMLRAATNDYMTPNDLYKITQKLGEPERVHIEDGFKIVCVKFA